MMAQMDPPATDNQLPAEAPPAKRKRTNLYIILGGVAVLGIATAALNLPAEDPATKPHFVTYEVTGGASASLTYTTDGSSTTEQQANAPLPWSKPLTIEGGVLYQVMAQNTAGQAGTVTCSITVDGVQKKTATASGPGAIAHCTYSPR